MAEIEKVSDTEYSVTEEKVKNIDELKAEIQKTEGLISQYELAIVTLKEELAQKKAEYDAAIAAGVIVE